MKPGFQTPGLSKVYTLVFLPLSTNCFGTHWSNSIPIFIKRFSFFLIMENFSKILEPERSFYKYILGHFPQQQNKGRSIRLKLFNAPFENFLQNSKCAPLLHLHFQRLCSLQSYKPYQYVLIINYRRLSLKICILFKQYCISDNSVIP